MKKIVNYINESYSKYNVDDLEEIDGAYMGSLGKIYIRASRCTLEEWAEAGKSWAEDALDNEEIDKDEYEDAIEHYNNFEDWAEKRL